MKMQSRFENGFTLLEILFAVAILLVILTTVFSAFYSYKKRQVVDVSAQIIVGALREARSKTLDSLDADSYGVHLGTDSVVLYAGVSYDPLDAENEVRYLAPPAEITAETLPANDVLFERLSGDALSFGTITVAVPGESEISKQVVIESTGISHVDSQ